MHTKFAYCNFISALYLVCCAYFFLHCNTCPTQELWNGVESCRDGEAFYRNLTTPTSEDLEMRFSRDQASTHEDIPLSYVEIFVSV